MTTKKVAACSSLMEHPVKYHLFFKTSYEVEMIVVIKVIAYPWWSAPGIPVAQLNPQPCPISHQKSALGLSSKRVWKDLQSTWPNASLSWIDVRIWNKLTWHEEQSWRLKGYQASADSGLLVMQSAHMKPRGKPFFLPRLGRSRREENKFRSDIGTTTIPKALIKTIEETQPSPRL